MIKDIVFRVRWSDGKEESYYCPSDSVQSKLHVDEKYSAHYP